MVSSSFYKYRRVPNSVLGGGTLLLGFSDEVLDAIHPKT
jgi:hypothetical protein